MNTTTIYPSNGLEIIGFPDYYISKDGIIFTNRLIKRGLKELKQCLDSCGYPMVSMYNTANRRVVCRVHRLLARQFLPDFNENLFVNHIDGVKTNNSLNNLEMVTRSENTKHSFELGLQVALKGENNPAAKLTERDVLLIRNMLSDNVFSGIKIAKLFNVSKRTIYRIRDGLSWSYLD